MVLNGLEDWGPCDAEGPTAALRMLLIRSSRLSKNV